MNQTTATIHTVHPVHLFEHRVEDFQSADLMRRHAKELAQLLYTSTPSLYFRAVMTELNRVRKANARELKRWKKEREEALR